MTDRPEQVTTLHDVLDDAADLSMTGRRLDPAAIAARAARPEYRPVVGRGAPQWRGRPVLGPRLLVAAAVLLALLTLATTFLPRVLAESPLPARTPQGEPGLPRTLRLAPLWTPSITEAPIARAGYVAVAATPSGPAADTDVADFTPSAAVWLVGADDGTLRTLPVFGTVAVDLSRDGRRVAWTGSGFHETGEVLDPPKDLVALLEVGTGERRDVRVPAPGGRTFQVESFRFDPAGDVLAVSGFVMEPGGALESYVVVLDVATGSVRPVCRPETLDRFPDWRGPGVLAVARCTPVKETEAAAWPAADPAAAGRLDVRQVPLADPPASMLTTAFSTPGYPVRAEVRVSGSGVRWVVTGDEEGEPAGDGLLADPPTATPGFVVTSDGGRTPLGTVGGAAGLATDGDDAVVSRWTPRAPDSAFGPSEVVRVPLAGGDPQVLTTADGVQVRAVAVAADAVASGRFFDAQAVRTYGDRAWWRYQLEILDLRGPLVLAGALLLGVAVVTYRRRRRT